MDNYISNIASVLTVASFLAIAAIWWKEHERFAAIVLPAMATLGFILLLLFVYSMGVTEGMRLRYESDRGASQLANKEREAILIKNINKPLSEDVSRDLFAASNKETLIVEGFPELFSSPVPRWAWFGLVLLFVELFVLFGIASPKKPVPERKQGQDD